MGIIDEIRQLTNQSRAEREEAKNEELEAEKARQKWLKEKQIPKLAKKHYRALMTKIKEAAKSGEDGVAFTVEHFGKPSRLDEETYPAIRLVRRKLVKDGFDVSDIESDTKKIHDTSSDKEDYKISCSIMVSW